jgi:hypothetical protein
MKKLFILYFLILAIGCSNKNVQEENAPIIEEGYIQSKMLEEYYPNLYIPVEKIIDPREERLDNLTIIYNTVINDDHVNIRAFPSIDANILFEVQKDTKVLIFGVSREIEEIDSHIGHWFKIRIEHEYGREGWVFSKYVEYKNITPSEITIVGLIPRNEMQGQYLRTSYQVYGIEITISIIPHKNKNQDFYTFVYDNSIISYHYTNIPGSYVWYPDTNEVLHISYIGHNEESRWVQFTDDFKYILQDGGTSPGPRGLGVWRLKDNKQIFSGTYYDKIDLQGYRIKIVYVYDNWNISRDELDEEILNYAEDFKNNNPTSNEFNNKLIIICEYNLDTGTRNIITGQYIQTQ